MEKLTKDEVKKKILGSIMSGKDNDKSEMYNKMKKKQGISLTIIIGEPEEKEDDESEDENKKPELGLMSRFKNKVQKK